MIRKWITVAVAAAAMSCGKADPAVDGGNRGPERDTDFATDAGMDGPEASADMPAGADVGRSDVGRGADVRDDAELADEGRGPCDVVPPTTQCVAANDCLSGICREDGWCEPDFDECTIGASPIETFCTNAVNGRAVVSFDVPAGLTSYTITPFVRSGAIAPRFIQLPSGEVIDVVNDNFWQSATAARQGWINPTVVPADTAHAAQLEVGAHSYVIDTTAAQVCWQLVGEDATAGNRLELVVHIVGLDFEAADAAANTDLSATLGQTIAILADAGVRAEVVEYRDVGEEDEVRFSIIRSEPDARDLTTRANEPREATREDVLRLHLFFVRSIAATFIGSAPGIAGPPGMLRTRASGVVVTSELMGTMPMGSFDTRVQDGNLVTGTALAHEIGHFLGLMHTSEFNGIHDPLDDTPECPQPLDTNCPDVNNFMFPAAADNHTESTQDQRDVIALHPLTR